MRNKQIESLVENINMNKKMQQVNLKYERENDSHYIRLYTGTSCLKTMFSGTPKSIIESLYAFRQGLLFQSTDYVR
jgi:hypothetical protein